MIFPRPSFGGGRVRQEMVSSRWSKVGENWEESNIWGQHKFQDVGIGGGRHRCISHTGYIGNGGWHRGAGREWMGHAELSACVLRLLLAELRHL